jgi:hypothetical protein
MEEPIHRVLVLPLLWLLFFLLNLFFWPFIWQQLFEAIRLNKRIPSVQEACIVLPTVHVLRDPYVEKTTWDSAEDLSIIETFRWRESVVLAIILRLEVKVLDVRSFVFLVCLDSQELIRENRVQCILICVR